MNSTIGPGGNKTRALAPTDGAFLIGEWLVEPRIDRLSRGDVSHRLEPKITAVLVHLAFRAPQLCSRDELLDEVWGDAEVGEEILTRAISELRRLLGDDRQRPRFIETVRRRGYRMLAEPEILSDRVASAESTLPPSQAAAERPRVGRFTIVAVFLAALSAGFWWTLRDRSPSGVSFEIPNTTPLTSYEGEEQYPALSPDGRYVAFSWGGSEGENVDVYVKGVDTESLLRLTHHDGIDTLPQWSPDGSSIAFFHVDEFGQRISSVPLIGGRPTEILEIDGQYAGHSWSPDGEHIAYAVTRPGRRSASIVVRHLASGSERSITESRSGGRGDIGPTVSPDGEYIAFVRLDASGMGDLHVIPWRGGSARRLTKGALIIEGFDWSPDSSSLVYSGISGATYQLFEVDLRSADVTPIPTRGEWVQFPSIASGTGDLVYQDIRFNKNIWRVTGFTDGERSITEQPLLASSRWDCEARYSPDGRQIAFISARSGSLELWVAAADGSDPLQLTSFNGISLGNPQWSPDGRWIAFHARPDGFADVFTIRASGGQPPSRLTFGEDEHLLSSWSRDGQRLYFSSKVDGQWDISYLDPFSPDRGVTRVTESGAIAAAETADGGSLLLARPDRAGLWHLPQGAPADGSPPSQMLADLPMLGDWSNWSTAGDSVVLVRYDEHQPEVVRFDLQTGSLEPIARIPGIARPSLTLSPDESAVLYARVDHRESDLMLVRRPD